MNENKEQPDSLAAAIFDMAIRSRLSAHLFLANKAYYI